MGPLDLVTETLQEAFCPWQFFYLRVVHVLAQIKELQNLLPLCTHCKKIRDDQNYWRKSKTTSLSTQKSDSAIASAPKCFERFVKPELEKYKGSGVVGP
jgi:hypothetical protein